MASISIGQAIRLSLKVVAAGIALYLICLWIGVDAERDETRLYLVIYSIDDRLLMKESVHLGQKVTIVYNHSVERVPVLEVFEVRGEGPLYLSELISRDALLSYPGYEQYYLSMLPWDGRSEGPLPIGLDITQRDWFIVKSIGQARVMPLMVGSCFVDHKMLVNSGVIRLREIAASGEIVRIFIKEE